MNKHQLFLALGMLITGSINTITNKVADWQVAEGKYEICPAFNATENRTLSPPPPSPPSPPPWPPLPPGYNLTNVTSGSDDGPCPFLHPFLQALVMFLGESTCLAAFYLSRFTARRQAEKVGKTLEPEVQFNKFIFLLPACCDMTATSLMYIGLNLTYASSFQMLRSAVVLFTAIISRVFLKRMIKSEQYFGVFLVIVGTGLVGMDAVINPDSSAEAPPSPVTGNIVIVLAQIVVAIQMCVEEVFVGGKNVHPLQAVGLEGCFGFSVLCLLLIAMYHLPGVENLSETRHHLEDAIDGLMQMGNNAVLFVFVFGGLISIAFFNFFGISVTKDMSAAHRMVLDSLRTMVVWAFSLTVRAVAPDSGHGQKFSFLQLGGFVVLVTGTLYYNGILGYGFAKRTRTDPLLLAAEQGWTVEEATPQPDFGSEPIVLGTALQADARSDSRR